MSYSILRVARVKGLSNSKGIQKHNQRENKNYNNKDINHENTYKNYDLINENKIDYSEKIEDTIHANYSGKRAIRKDAIKHVDGLITSDNEFFNGLSEEETKQFFKDSLEFLEGEYGKENMLYATVHLDEKVPHMHFGFVPLTDDGRLSAKEKLGNKKAMTELQDRFNQYVNSKGYELQRGTAKEVSEREHQDIDKYKKETEYHQNQLEEKQKEHEKIDASLEQLVSEYQQSVEMLDIDIDVKYDNEIERVKNFIGRVTDEFETGRIIMDKEDFEKIKHTAKTGAQAINVLDQFQQQDFYKENQRLQFDLDETTEIMSVWKREYEKELETTADLKQENSELKVENKMWKSNNAQMMEHLAILYETSRKHFKGFENGFNKLSEVLSRNEKTKPVSDFMNAVQHSADKRTKKMERRQARYRDNGMEL